MPTGTAVCCLDVGHPMIITRALPLTANPDHHTLYFDPGRTRGCDNARFRDVLTSMARCANNIGMARALHRPELATFLLLQFDVAQPRQTLTNIQLATWQRRLAGDLLQSYR